MNKTNLHSISTLMQKGSDQEMTETEIMREALPVRTAINQIKQGKGSNTGMIRCFEFIYVGMVMTEVIKQNINEGADLIAQRERSLRDDVDTITAYIKRCYNKPSRTARGGEIKAFDRGVSTTIELMSVAPKWVYTQACANMVHIDRMAMSKIKGKPAKPRVKRKARVKPAKQRR